MNKKKILSFFLLLSVGVIDFITGPELSASIFYLLPIMFISWYDGKKIGIAAAFFSAALWLFSDMVSGHDYSHPAIPYWNALVRLGIFLIVCFIIIEMQAQLAQTQEANKKLEAANREITELANIKSDFTSTVSHELRTPLTAIKESLGIIRDRSAGPLTASQEDYLDTIIRNVTRLNRLINDVLDFQKLEAGKMKFKSGDVDVNQLIRETAKSFHLLAQTKQIKITLESDNSLPVVKSDADGLMQVLNNFVGNAIRYSDHGEVKICSEKINGSLKVSVKDTGRGIPPDKMPELFESFSQLSTPQSRESGSTGLGLAISKKIIEELGGTIGAHSEYGKGSVFYFTLRCGHAE